LFLFDALIPIKSRKSSIISPRSNDQSISCVDFLSKSDFFSITSSFRVKSLSSSAHFLLRGTALRIQENIQQRIPKLGSEVRFADGITAGRIKSLNNNAFVVIRGKKRIRRLVFPYSSIATIGNRIVTLRNTKSGALSKSSLNTTERDCVTKRKFIKEIDKRLELGNLDRSERVARITLYLMSLKLSQEQKKQFRRILPPGIRSMWTSVEQPGSGRSFNMSDYLAPIKKQGRFQTMEEAFIAAREVFSSLKTLMPAVNSMEISHSMPKGLQEIWDCAQ
jgi:uncharacterized protein (DUF2267 family)